MTSIYKPSNTNMRNDVSDSPKKKKVWIEICVIRHVLDRSLGPKTEIFSDHH